MKERLLWWFTFLGGALAWFFHLLTVYAIGESFCLLEGSLFVFLGLNAATWFLALVTLIALSIAGAAIVLARRRQKAFRNQTADPRGYRFLSAASLLSNVLFILVIIAETIPVFFFVEEC